MLTPVGRGPANAALCIRESVRGLGDGPGAPLSVIDFGHTASVGDGGLGMDFTWISHETPGNIDRFHQLVEGLSQLPR